jgi:hypothetical protein
MMFVDRGPVDHFWNCGFLIYGVKAAAGLGLGGGIAVIAHLLHWNACSTALLDFRRIHGSKWAVALMLLAVTQMQLREPEQEQVTASSKHTPAQYSVGKRRQDKATHLH